MKKREVGNQHADLSLLFAMGYLNAPLTSLLLTLFSWFWLVDAELLARTEEVAREPIPLLDVGDGSAVALGYYTQIVALDNGVGVAYRALCTLLIQVCWVEVLLQV